MHVQSFCLLHLGSRYPEMERKTCLCSPLEVLTVCSATGVWVSKGVGKQPCRQANVIKGMNWQLDTTGGRQILEDETECAHTHHSKVSPAEESQFILMCKCKALLYFFFTSTSLPGQLRLLCHPVGLQHVETQLGALEPQGSQASL